MAGVNFCSDGEAAIHRHLDVKPSSVKEAVNIRDLYETDRCVSWITTNAFKKVALQFGDESLKNSTFVAMTLKHSTDAEVFILGDTSYGSCCVDEVAAQHGSADAVIHFGHSCLSATQRLPVLYIFGCHTVDGPHCSEQLQSVLSDTSSKIILLYDVIYYHAIDELKMLICKTFTNVIASTLNIPDGVHRNMGGSAAVSVEDATSTRHSSRKTLSKCGRTIDLPEGTRLDNYLMCYIGAESATLTNLLMTFNKCQFYTYDPQKRVARHETANVNRMLMRRYYLIEKAKDARIIGILVGTLGVVDYLAVIQRMKELVRAAGKKSYMFVVGKLNVAKLANFMEIDVFVHIACAENTLVDSSEFYKPVITPYELEVACNSAQEWTGEYVTDFRELLPGGSAHADLAPDTSESRTDVSLITGGIRQLGRTDSETEDCQVASQAVVKRDEKMFAVSSVSATSGAEFLSTRSFQGLDPRLGQTPVEKAVEGTTGIASGYSSEPTLK